VEIEILFSYFVKFDLPNVKQTLQMSNVFDKFFICLTFSNIFKCRYAKYCGAEQLSHSGVISQKNRANEKYKEKVKLERILGDIIKIAVKPMHGKKKGSDAYSFSLSIILDFKTPTTIPPIPPSKKNSLILESCSFVNQQYLSGRII
jgi:hypothetical protein